MSTPPAPVSASGPAPVQARSLQSPATAVVWYTLRACLPVKRWVGVLLPCLGALAFGWLSVLGQSSDAENFADVAEAGLFALILPITCLVLGDAVLGADVRAGTFPLTWLSPVRFPTIAVGRWLGGWVVALATLIPALALAPLIAGTPDAVGPMVVAGAVGSAAYISLFMLVGVLVRRSTIWSLAIVLLGEWLLGSQLTGVAQISPLWQAQQTFAGLWDHGSLIEREGMPSGGAAVLRLVLVTLVCLTLAAWRLGRMRPVGTND